MNKATTRQWIIFSTFALTLGAVVWVNQFENSDAQSKPEKINERSDLSSTASLSHTSTANTVIKTRYKNSEQDIFDVPARQSVSPVIPQSYTPPVVIPPLPFTYLGRVVENGRERIFLASAQKNYLAQRGDVLENDYRIDRINEHQILFTYLPLKIGQTLETGAAQ
jgi:hypothetical protein